MEQEKFLWDNEDPNREPCPYCKAEDNLDTVLADFPWEYLTALGCG